MKYFILIIFIIILIIDDLNQRALVKFLNNEIQLVNSVANRYEYLFKQCSILIKGVDQ